MKKYLVLFAVLLAVLLSSEAAEARGLLPGVRARVRARVADRVAARRGLARRPVLKVARLDRPRLFQVAARNRFARNRAVLLAESLRRSDFRFFAPHFDRRAAVAFLPRFNRERLLLLADDPRLTYGVSYRSRRVQLVELAASDPCDVSGDPTIDPDLPPLSASFRRRLIAEY